VLEVSGLRIGVLGIAPQVKSNKTNLINSIQPDKALQDILPSLRPNVDIIILLSQYSMREVEIILQDIKGVDLVIASSGGSTSGLIKMENGTHIISTGSGCSKLQTAALTLNKNQIINVQKETIKLDELVIPDPDILSVTGMDKNQTIGELRKKELEIIKKQTQALSKADPMEVIKRMSADMDMNSEEAKARIEKQLNLKDQ
jgi:2',3'-cyclic-nucleotide 2'-phosphodiesterase (5'-nucleotidase family)